MSAVTSRFVYISRRRVDIIDSAVKGAFLSLKLEVQDSIERPRKFPTYLVTRFPVGVDPSLAKELPGVYTARRFHQYGTPISRLVITWSLSDPPPSEFTFSFLPCLPPCELRKMKDEQPWCYKCWGIGHISRYCSAPSDKCGWCAGTHDSRTCPHSTPSQPTSADGASTSKQPSLSTADTSVNQESTCGMAVRAAPPLPSQLSTRCLPLFTPPVKHHHHGRGPAPPPILQPLPRLSRHKLPLFVKLSQS